MKQRMCVSRCCCDIEAGTQFGAEVIQYENLGGPLLFNATGVPAASQLRYAGAFQISAVCFSISGLPAGSYSSARIQFQGGASTPEPFQDYEWYCPHYPTTRFADIYLPDSSPAIAWNQSAVSWLPQPSDHLSPDLVSMVNAVTTHPSYTPTPPGPTAHVINLLLVPLNPFSFSMFRDVKALTASLIVS